MISFVRSAFHEVAEFKLEPDFPVLQPGTFVCWLDGKFHFDSEEDANLLGVVLTERRSHPYKDDNRHLVVAISGIICTLNYNAELDVHAKEFFIDDGVITHVATDSSTPISLDILSEPSVGCPYLTVGLIPAKGLDEDLYEYAAVEG